MGSVPCEIAAVCVGGGSVWRGCMAVTWTHTSPSYCHPQTPHMTGRREGGQKAEGHLSACHDERVVLRVLVRKFIHVPILQQKKNRKEI